MKYFIKSLFYWKALFSPFVPFKLKWYFGKIKVGVPYFYPRKTIKDPNKQGYLKFVPLKVGFSYCSLGYKTKWSDTDYRFEWSPIFSFVFFGYQIACIINTPEPDHYWEAWLYYNYHTDKLKTKDERIQECIDNFPLTYIVSNKDGERRINYYDVILRKKYKKWVKV